MAILIAMVAILLISYLATEIGKETANEYLLSRNEINRLKAYYSARNATEIALLQIYIYKNAKANFADKIPDPAMLEKIWQFPFMWPLMLGDEATSSSKDEMAQSMNESFMDAEFSVQITTEGSKIDLNDLASPSKAIRESTRNQLVQILSERMDQDDEWAERNRDLEPEKIINNIADWVDTDSESLNGGDESAAYREREDIARDQNFNWPPNRAFRTQKELFMVAGVSEDIYEVLSPNITLFGAKGININSADLSLIKSIGPAFNEELIAEISKYRQDPNLGSFKDLKDFEAFLQGQGVSGEYNPNAVLLLFDSEYNFRIEANGSYSTANRKITAIVYDELNAINKLDDALSKEDKKNNETESEGSADTQKQNEDQEKSGENLNSEEQEKESESAKFDQGRPNIIFWQEN